MSHNKYNKQMEKVTLDSETDFSEKEIELIISKIKEIKFAYSKGENVEVLKPFTLREVEKHEDKIGIKLPIAFKNYITKVSKEFWYNDDGFKVVFNLNEITSDTTSIYLSGMSCSFNNCLVLKQRSFGKIKSSCARGGYVLDRSKISFNNFKSFVMSVLQINLNS